jgi:hypothetical protein
MERVVTTLDTTPTLDNEARDEAARELCENLWAIDPDASESDFRIARLEADMAIDCYLGRLLAGDAQMTAAIDAAGPILWPGSWRTTANRKVYRESLVRALEAAAPHFLAWGMKNASEQIGRAYTTDAGSARPERWDA